MVSMFYYQWDPELLLLRNDLLRRDWDRKFLVDQLGLVNRECRVLLNLQEFPFGFVSKLCSFCQKKKMYPVTMKFTLTPSKPGLAA